MSDDHARFAVMRGLKKAIAAHRSGRWDLIGDGWDTAARFRHDDAALSIALSFWDGWADSAAHGWLYYGDLRADDWPRLAEEIAAALDARQPITHPSVLTHFSPRLSHKLRRRYRRRLWPHRSRVMAAALAFTLWLLVAATALAVVFFITPSSDLTTYLVALALTFLVAPLSFGSMTDRLEHWLIHRWSRKRDSARRRQPGHG